MKYVTLAYVIRTTLFLLLIVGSWVEWRRDLAVNELLEAKTRLTEAMERKIQATEKERDLWKMRAETKR